MIDIQFIRDNPELVKEKAAQKGYPVEIDRLLELDTQRKDLLQAVETLRNERNQIASDTKNKPSEQVVERGRIVKTKLSVSENELKNLENEWQALYKKVPNMPLDYVPIGATEDGNIVIKTVGEPTTFDFEPKSHAQIAEVKGWLDKERAAKIAGSRFAYLKGNLVRLQFAIVQYVMNTLASERILKQIAADNKLVVSTKPFMPVIPPAMIKTEPYEGTSRLDREEITYKIEQDDLWMNASAEHSIVPMYMGESLDEKELPIRYIGYSTSFRREAGSYGKDMEGMFRMHQFDKLEMETFTTPETGLVEHKFLVAIQEYFMQQLGLPYRLVEKCTADIGFANAAGIDVETWLPGQDKYRETHSADYMTNYQARRLKTRVKRNSGNDFVHTNDATALVLSRIPVAIMENYQTADGDVIVPKVLRKYMDDVNKI